MDVTGGDEPHRVRVAAVGPQFFLALASAPAKGRVLQATDYPPDAPRAVVISGRVWGTEVGGRADIVGLTVELNAVKRPIVGVLPPGTRWPMDIDVWVPFRITTEQDPDL